MSMMSEWDREQIFKMLDEAVDFFEGIIDDGALSINYGLETIAQRKIGILRAELDMLRTEANTEEEG